MMTMLALSTPAKNSKTTRYAVYISSNFDGGGAADLNFVCIQRKAIKAYLSEKKLEGWMPIPETYEDIGRSGGLASRPALRRLLADAEAGKMDCLVCYSFDCVTRSHSDKVEFVMHFRRHNVAINQTGPMLAIPDGRFGDHPATGRKASKRSRKAPPPNPTQCAIYLYGQIGKGASPNCIEEQRKQIGHFLRMWRSMSPISVVETYEDIDSTSGAPRQPALKTLLADVHTSSIDCVVAYTLDRFGQAVVDYEQLFAKFRMCGVGLVTVCPRIFHVLSKRLAYTTGS